MNNKVVLKILVICGAVFLVFGIIAAIFAAGTAARGWQNEKFFSIGRGEPFEYHKNENFDLDGVTQVNVGTVSTDVVFYQSDSELEVTLDCSGYTNKETITLETNQVGSVVNVKIKYPKYGWNSWGGINITQSLLQIGIPEDYAESVQVSGVSSEIRMNSHLANSFVQFDIDTVSGNADVQCLQIDVLEFDSTSGDLKVERTILNSVSADTTSGDMNIANVGSEGGKVGISTISGRVKIFYDELCETRVNTTSGDVQLDIPDDSKIDLDFDSVSGDVSGDYNKNSDGVSVNIDTVSGDLDIY